MAPVAAFYQHQVVADSADAIWYNGKMPLLQGGLDVKVLQKSANEFEYTVRTTKSGWGTTHNLNLVFSVSSVPEISPELEGDLQRIASNGDGAAGEGPEVQPQQSATAFGSTGNLQWEFLSLWKNLYFEQSGTIYVGPVQDIIGGHHAVLQFNMLDSNVLDYVASLGSSSTSDAATPGGVPTTMVSVFNYKKNTTLLMAEWESLVELRRLEEVAGNQEVAASFVECFTTVFCHNEVLAQAAQITPAEFIPFAEAYLQFAVSEGLSYVAVDGTQVIGFLLNEDAAGTSTHLNPAPSTLPPQHLSTLLIYICLRSQPGNCGRWAGRGSRGCCMSQVGCSVWLCRANARVVPSTSWTRATARRSAAYLGSGDPPFCTRQRSSHVSGRHVDGSTFGAWDLSRGIYLLGISTLIRVAQLCHPLSSWFAGSDRGHGICISTPRQEASDVGRGVGFHD